LSPDQISPALALARLRLTQAQLIAQIGSDDVFERLIEAQVAALRAARDENKSKLIQVEEQIAMLDENLNGAVVFE
jgi:hypothetical protein